MLNQGEFGASLLQLNNENKPYYLSMLLANVSAHPCDQPCRPTTWGPESGIWSVGPECPWLLGPESPVSPRPTLQAPLAEGKTSGGDANVRHGRSSTSGQHVAHGAHFQRRQVLLVESDLDSFEHLSF